MRALPFVSVLVVLLAAGCRGNRLPVPGARGARPDPRPVHTSPDPSLPTRFDKVVGKDVRLSPRDLQPVDAWLGARNSQWIIGDTVDIYASKEYFSSMLTLNAKAGLVHKQQAEYRGDTVTTLTYVGAAHATNAMRAPRAFIGQDQRGGLTVSARRVLRVRMAKTRDPSRPVQLRIVARGKAVHGRAEEAARRADQLELGGALRRSGGRWYWIPVER